MGEYSGARYSTDRDTGLFTVNPFVNAVDFANDVKTFVDEQFIYVKEAFLGDGNINAIAATTTAINNLANFPLQLPEDIDLLHPEFDLTVDMEFNLPEVTASDFGMVTPWTPRSAPTPDTLPVISDVNIPGFVPSIGSITIPDPPEATYIPDPGDGPATPPFVFPGSPILIDVDKPSLYGLTVPLPPSYTLPTLDLVPFPTLPELEIDTLINWTEPAYSPEIWADVKAQLQTFLAGGTGMRPDVEEAIVNRSRNREDRIVNQQIEDALTEWSSRGYTAPPGMLAKRIDYLREEGTLKKLGLAREVTIKAMDQELENLRFACQQGIVAEGLFVQIFLAAAERLFLVQRLHVELQIQYYNTLIAAFNAKLAENQIRAQVYEVQVRAVLAEIEVYKALLSGEQIKADINKTLVEQYKIEIEARESFVTIYEAQVRAVGVEAQVFATEIEAYRGQIQAFAARVDADKSRFDAYTSRIQGEAAKVGIIEAEARAYQAEIGGIEAGVRAETAALEGAVEAFRAEILAYNAELSGLTSRSQAELAALQANVAGYQADTQRFIAATGAEEAKSRLELGSWEAKSRIEVAYFEAQLARYKALLERVIQQAGMALEGIKSSGSLASTISAGALAAMHVGASMTGSGSIGASGSDSVSTAFSDSESKSCSDSRSLSISFESDTEPTLECTV